MTTHEMRLHPRPFNNIREGRQTIESRLYDEKRQQIQVGDHIVFSLRPDYVEKVEAEVVELLRAPTFAALFALRPQAEFGNESPPDVEKMFEYYSKEDEQKYGVVGIRFRKIA